MISRLLSISALLLLLSCGERPLAPIIVAPTGEGEQNPTKPDPTKPTDPDPTKPTDPTDPTDPDPTKPTDPVVPDPTKPTEPKPTDPEPGVTYTFKGNIDMVAQSFMLRTGKIIGWAGVVEEPDAAVEVKVYRGGTAPRAS